MTIFYSLEETYVENERWRAGEVGSLFAVRCVLQGENGFPFHDVLRFLINQMIKKFDRNNGKK
jgi:hypothetical protein